MTPLRIARIADRDVGGHGIVSQHHDSRAVRKGKVEVVSYSNTNPAIGSFLLEQREAL